jgi:F0F1-type ATP synthase membrane subunit b/b'
MSELGNLWNLIVASNAFNFVVLVAIIAVVMSKLKVSEMLSALKDSIIAKIESSKKAKADAELSLSDAMDKVKNLDSEVDNKLSLAKMQADNVAKSIQEAANRRVKQISANVDKVIDSESKTLYTKLSDDTVRASVSIATDYITRRLKENPNLHNRYIDEGINELEKVVF